MGFREVSPDTAALALAGDPEAQSTMFCRIIEMGMNREASDDLLLEGALAWGRLAASHGRPDDVLRLAGVLMLKAGVLMGMGDQDAGTVLVAEALVRLERLADEGNEEAARQINAIADTLAIEGVDAGAFSIASSIVQGVEA